MHFLFLLLSPLISTSFLPSSFVLFLNHSSPPPPPSTSFSLLRLQLMTPPTTLRNKHHQSHPAYSRKHPSVDNVVRVMSFAAPSPSSLSDLPAFFFIITTIHNNTHHKKSYWVSSPALSSVVPSFCLPL